MKRPSITGLATSLAESITSSSLCLSDRLAGSDSSSYRLNKFSIITTEASTNRPKSIAPKLIKFAEIPKNLIPVTANNIENGIAIATKIAALKLPSNSSSTATTNAAPSAKLFVTVLIVWLTKKLRV